MSLNLARDSWYTASCIHNVLIRVISYGWGFTLFIGTAELPKEDDRSPLPLREYLSKLPRDSYVVVKDQVCWLGAKKTNYIVQGGETMADYRNMWDNLGMNLERHDLLCEALPDAFHQVYISQENRPEGMDYYDFVVAEIHG